MKWRGRRKSSNVEDRRGGSTGKIAAGGGIIAVIFIAFQLFTGGDVGEILNQMQQQQDLPSEKSELTSEEIELGDYSAIVLADTEDVWNQLFGQGGSEYSEPGMVLFSNSINTACGEVGHHV